MKENFIITIVLSNGFIVEETVTETPLKDIILLMTNATKMIDSNIEGTIKVNDTITRMSQIAHMNFRKIEDNE